MVYPALKGARGRGQIENLLWSGTFLPRHAECTPPPCSASPLPHPCFSPAKVPTSRSLGKAVERKHDPISESVLQGNWCDGKNLLLELRRGLPWWDSGQCRRHRFDPWSGKIPHAAEQLRLCHNYWARTLGPTSCNDWSPRALEPHTTTTEPTCSRATHHNYRTHVLHLLKPSHPEPVLCNKRSHRSEKPTHHNKV